MIQVRDPINGDVNDPNAHGTGFDRVGAFQDGFIGGAERCKPFFTEDREKNLIDIPFDFGDPNQGNLPFDTNGADTDIVTAMPQDLDRFWVQKLTGLDGVTFTAPTLELFPSAGPFPDCDGVDQDALQAAAHLLLQVVEQDPRRRGLRRHARRRPVPRRHVRRLPDRRGLQRGGPDAPWAAR